MEFYYSDTFNLPLPPKHRFPGSKYGKLRAELLKKEILKPSNLKESPLATRVDIELAHCPQYIDDFYTGNLDIQKMKRIGFPWSEFLVKRIRATMGGAIAAAESALEYGLSGQLAGGTHHAHYDYGGGYCIFNDFAITALKLIAENKVDRVAVIDLDVHQGDGNASLLKENKSIFVLSVHGEKNYPFKKFPSDLDVPLPDKCDDSLYIKKLCEAVEAVYEFKPDLILYQAGVDVLEHDRLGRLNLSYEGLRQRDELVLSSFKKKGTPVSMALGGGYSDPIEHTIKGYTQTYEVAKKIHSF